MNRRLIFISAQPAEPVFLWQLSTQLYNFRRMGISSMYQILLYQPPERDKPDERFMELARAYPEAKFFFYIDKKGECKKLIQGFEYPPIIRPWCLRKHFKRHFTLKEEAIFYLDSDVIFTKPPTFLNKLLDDDVCYLSETHNYISATYFDSKLKDVRETKVEDYKKIDVLDTCAKIVGIDRQICEANDLKTGGAQYLLKNVDEEFWTDVEANILYLLTYLENINQAYFKGITWKDRENAGFQRWCSDMWAVLWNLWKRGMVTEVPKEMDFAWSGEPIEEWENNYIYHDAQPQEGCFDKGRYRDGLFYPTDDDLSWVSPEKCSFNYVKEIINSKVTFKPK